MSRASVKPRVRAPAAESSNESTVFFAPLQRGTKSIRLFRISPGSPGERLELELKVFYLESADCPPFASLSYMWGVDDACYEIMINGAPLKIRPNAFLFLDTLRNHQRRRVKEGSEGLPGRYPRGNFLSPGSIEVHLEWIWMDSICINQSDPDERNHQVRLMQEIYGLADHVFFHIGYETATAQRVIDGMFPEKNWQILQRWAKRGWPKHIMGDVAKIINGSAYANRLWIIQELVLGRQVSFVTADWIVPFPELAGAGALDSIDTARHNWHVEGAKENPKENRGPSLVSLLNRYSRHRCKEKVDRVFGLLGICSEKIPIDYNLSPRSVALETLAYIIFNEPNGSRYKRVDDPEKMDRSMRMADAIKCLEVSLDYELADTDYNILARRLGEMAFSLGRSPSEYWWFSSASSESTPGTQLQRKLTYDPPWDTGYDSTAEGNFLTSTKKRRREPSSMRIPQAPGAFSNDGFEQPRRQKRIRLPSGDDSDSD